MLFRILFGRADRLAAILGADGHLHAAPELVVEVLSPGRKNERRDREAKLDLYRRRKVEEYWLADWQHRQVDGALQIVQRIGEGERLVSPLLPGFACILAELFAGL